MESLPSQGLLLGSTLRTPTLQPAVPTLWPLSSSLLWPRSNSATSAGARAGATGVQRAAALEMGATTPPTMKSTVSST